MTLTAEMVAWLGDFEPRHVQLDSLAANCERLAFSPSKSAPPSDPQGTRRRGFFAGNGAPICDAAKPAALERRPAEHCDIDYVRGRLPEIDLRRRRRAAGEERRDGKEDGGRAPQSGSAAPGRSGAP
jgi:hypothetical protein